MLVVSEMVHPAGLSFAMQRKAFVARHVQKKPWKETAKKVRNLQGDCPSVRTLRRYCAALSIRHGRVRSGYANCRRLAKKVTPVVERFLAKRLRALRRLPVNRVLVKFPPPEHVPERMED
jgi:hypothetical protein